MMAIIQPANFDEAMARIKALRFGGLRLDAARDAFLRELGFETWSDFIAKHPQCRGRKPSSPNDRGSY
jgi:hypothetical protein